MFRVCNGAELPAFGISRASSKKTCDNRKLSLISSNTFNASSGVQAVSSALWGSEGPCSE
jgi:hypothetical protein